MSSFSMRSVLSASILFWASSASFTWAQTDPGVVLFYCSEALPLRVGQSSPGAPVVDAHAGNCTEELSRVLAAGYAIAFAGSGDGETPFFVLLDARANLPGDGNSDAAVLKCGFTREFDEYVVRLSGVSSALSVATGPTARCADQISRLLAAGLTLRHVHVSKDEPWIVYFVLTGGGGRSAGSRSASGRKRRSRPPVRTAVLGCAGGFSTESISVDGISSSDPTLPVGSLYQESCGEVLATLLSSGYRIFHVDGGEDGDGLVFSLVQP